MAITKIDRFQPAQTQLLGGSVDAFGRQRISSPTSVVSIKQTGTQPTNLINVAVLSGSGATSSYSANRASTTLSVANLTAAQIVNQSRQRLEYEPGKSGYVAMTFVLGAAATGITRRIGLFDASNGLFLEHTSSGYSFVVRSFVSGATVDTEIPQSSWNIDKLDGSGLSGTRVTLDPTRAIILEISFQWLGVGSITYGFNINGISYPCHRVDNSNIITGVYMSTPILPLRWELNNSGAGPIATLETICGTGQSEGNTSSMAFPRSISRGNTAFTAATSGVMYPIIAARVNPNAPGIITLKSISILTSTASNNMYWTLHVNPVIAGADAASWQTINGSSLQFDTSRTATNVITDSANTRILSGYVSSTGRQISLPTDLLIQLGGSAAGVSDILQLGVAGLAANTTVLASMDFNEQI